jgi:hypothetical protein
MRRVRLQLLQPLPQLPNAKAEEDTDEDEGVAEEEFVGRMLQTPNVGMRPLAGERLLAKASKTDDLDECLGLFLFCLPSLSFMDIPVIYTNRESEAK